MNILRRILLALCVLLCFVLGEILSVSLTYAAPQSIPPFGVPNFGRYCKSIGDIGVILDKNPNGSTDAYGYHCITPSGDHVPFSVTDACHKQYGPNTIDVFTNFHVANSWLCYKGLSLLGAPDFKGYCISLGFTGVSVRGPTAYNWACVTQAGTHVHLTVRQQWEACNWTFNRDTIGRVLNFYDPYSWECWS